MGLFTPEAVTRLAFIGGGNVLRDELGRITRGH
jgi:hypothetical protein